MAHILAESDDARPPRWAADGSVAVSLLGHTASVNAVVTHVSGQKYTLFSGGGDDCIRVWDMSGACLQTFDHAHDGYVSSLLLHGEYLLSASFDRTIRLWNVERREQLRSIKAHANCVNALCQHSATGTVLSASWDSCIRVWDLRASNGNKGYASVLRLPSAGLCVACDTETSVYCGLHDTSVVSIDLRTGKLLETMTGHTGYVTALALANLVVALLLIFLTLTHRKLFFCGCRRSSFRRRRTAPSGWQMCDTAAAGR
jgi:WD40 repeat protein